MLNKISFSDLLFVKISRCLKGNLLTSLSLTFISISTYVLFCLIFEIVMFIICEILINYNLVNYAMGIEKFSIYIKLLGVILFLAPYNLSVKNWYYNLNEDYNTNVLDAFIVFSSFEFYFKSLFFCVIKLFAFILNSILKFISFAVIYAVFSFMVITNEYSDSVTTAVLFLAMVILICTILDCFSNFFSFVVADFMFLSNINSKNNIFYYFKLISNSKKIVKQNSLNLLKLSPIALIILIFPFAVPCLNLGLAINIKQAILKG